MHRHPLLRRVEARALRHGPALQRAVELEPEVVVQRARRVLLDHERERLAALGCCAARLGRDAEVALLLIGRQRVRHQRAFDRPQADGASPSPGRAAGCSQAGGAVRGRGLRRAHDPSRIGLAKGAFPRIERVTPRGDPLRPAVRHCSGALSPGLPLRGHPACSPRPVVAPSSRRWLPSSISEACTISGDGKRRAVRWEGLVGRRARDQQQLRDDGRRDRLGLLAVDAGQADRAGHAGDRRRRDAALLEAADELAALGLRADQPEEAEVGAPQDRLGDPQVEVVAVRQHQVERAGRCRRDLALDPVDADRADVRRPRHRGAVDQRGRELVLALVDPVDAHVHRRERARDRAADVAGAIELQVKARRGRGPAASASLSSAESDSVTAPPQHWPSAGPSG